MTSSQWFGIRFGIRFGITETRVLKVAVRGER